MLFNRTNFLITDEREASTLREARAAPPWLKQASEQLSVIANLPVGWDSHGAPRPTRRLVEAALDLLACLAKVPGVPKPHINPTPSGGVQFEWEAEARYFEIEVVGERTAAYFFQDEVAAAEEEGGVSASESLDEVINDVQRVGGG